MGKVQPKGKKHSTNNCCFISWVSDHPVPMLTAQDGAQGRLQCLAEVLGWGVCGSVAVTALWLPWQRVNLPLAPLPGWFEQGWGHRGLAQHKGFLSRASCALTSPCRIQTPAIFTGINAVSAISKWQDFPGTVTVQHWGRSNTMQLMVTACTREFNGTKSLNLSFRHCLVTMAFLITAIYGFYCALSTDSVTFSVILTWITRPPCCPFSFQQSRIWKAGNLLIGAPVLRRFCWFCSVWNTMPIKLPWRCRKKKISACISSWWLQTKGNTL